jgi:hypothetical protein
MEPTYMPNADLAYVDVHQKLLKYLLDPNHPEGAAKAKILLSMGYSRSAPDLLKEALLNHAQMPCQKVIQTNQGLRYVIEAYLHSSDELIRVRYFRSIWQAEGNSLPRLITAYPIKHAS